MKKVFISHPFSDNPQKNRKSADKICRALVKTRRDILPISPLHLWSFMKEDGIFREPILQACADLIDMCDEVWIYVKCDSSNILECLSSGQLWEYQVARRKNKKIRFKCIN